MTSGTTSGASSAKPNKARPGNRENRAIAKPARVPRISARVAAIVATSRLVAAAARNPSSAASAPYQWIENPAHTATSREWLNEYSTNRTIGA